MPFPGVRVGSPAKDETPREAVTNPTLSRKFRGYLRLYVFTTGEASPFNLQGNHRRSADVAPVNSAERDRPSRFFLDLPMPTV